MATSSSSSIDGLVSGLDTSSLISNLMAVERQPRDLMDTRRKAQQAAIDAINSIETKLGAAATAAAALQRSPSWTLRAATSSNDAVAAASVTSGASIGTLSFTVAQTASAHALVTANSVAATDTVVASGGSLNLTIGGEAETVSVGSGTLQEVSDAINSAGLAVRAAIVNTGSGYRLQISSTTTGATSAFTVDSGLDVNTGGTAVSTQGTDARITVGTGPGAYDVTSSTNAFSDVLPGVTITAKQVSATAVTVDVTADSAGLAAKVSAMVDSLNAAISEIKTRTAYDPATKSAASLNGESATRRLTASLSSAITEAVNQSSLVAPGLAGISVDKSGSAVFDKAKFLAEYAKDPAAVERLFTQGATSSGQVSFAFAGDRVAGGTYAVTRTSLATAATQTGFTGGLPVTRPSTLKVRTGSTVATYEIGVADDMAAVRAGIQTAIDAAGLAIDAAEGGGGLQFTARNAGLGGSFEVDWDGTDTWVPAAGVDAVGTIDGVTASGDATTLTVPATDSRLGGLSVTVEAGATGAVGSIVYEPGLAQRLITAVKVATDETGYLASAEQARQTRIDAFTRSIDSYDRRLVLRQETLKKQFALLEVALGRMKSQSDWLAGQLNSLNVNSSSK